MIAAPNEWLGDSPEAFQVLARRDATAVTHALLNGLMANKDSAQFAGFSRRYL
jgi:hypothetical protein